MVAVVHCFRWLFLHQVPSRLHGYFQSVCLSLPVVSLASQLQYAALDVHCVLASHHVQVHGGGNLTAICAAYLQSSPLAICSSATFPERDSVVVSTNID